MKGRVINVVSDKKEKRADPSRKRLNGQRVSERAPADGNVAVHADASTTSCSDLSLLKVLHRACLVWPGSCYAVFLRGIHGSGKALGTIVRRGWI